MSRLYTVGGERRMEQNQTDNRERNSESLSCAVNGGDIIGFGPRAVEEVAVSELAELRCRGSDEICQMFIKAGFDVTRKPGSGDSNDELVVITLGNCDSQRPGAENQMPPLSEL